MKTKPVKRKPRIRWHRTTVRVDWSKPASSLAHWLIENYPKDRVIVSESQAHLMVVERLSGRIVITEAQPKFWGTIDIPSKGQKGIRKVKAP